jgi:tellurite resistance protein TerC
VIWIWIGFITLIMLLLALDLGVFHRKSHVISMKEALSWSALWATLAVSFTAFVYFGYERHWLGLGMAADAVDGVVNDGRLAASSRCPRSTSTGCCSGASSAPRSCAA